MKTWYAVYTKKDCEKNVIYHLIRKNIKYYYPLNKVMVHDKFVINPLFPSYIFLFISEAELQYINKIRGVINPLFWKNQPVDFGEEEMNRIKSFLINHTVIELKKIDVQAEPVHNEVYENENYTDPIEKSNINIALSIPKLGVVLKAERIPSQAFKFKKEQPLNKFLFRLGWTNL